MDKTCSGEQSKAWQGPVSMQPGSVKLGCRDGDHQIRAQTQNGLDPGGSRGMGAVQAFLLGSVSRKLVHCAKCSVLVVK
jgi:hypothetical protein